MTDAYWQALATVTDSLSAQVVVERLQLEGIPARFEADTSILGVARRCRIFVPSEQIRRAEWVLSRDDFTDQELAFLATGELEAEESKDE